MLAPTVSPFFVLAPTVVLLLLSRPGTVRVRFHAPIVPSDFPDTAELIDKVRAAIESGLAQDED